MTPRFDLIGLVVADMPATLAFYRSLGLDIPADADNQSHVEVTLPGGIRLAWDSIEEIHTFDPEWQPSRSSSISTAFLVDSPAEVDSTHEAAVAAGYRVHKAPWDAFWGQRYLTLLDPDGNHVDVFAPLPA